MDLLPAFLQVISTYHATGKKNLLAVSGGLDSTVLCELSHTAGLQFAIAHCNFGLRGEESERDEVFVRSLATKYGIEIFVKKFDTDTYAQEHKLSIQEAARKLRYDWFEAIRIEKKFGYTLLAHHANDTIETVVMNFFRGTGLDGLTGMPTHNKEGANCLRPLLTISRKDIEAFAKENNLEWVEDSSNSSSKYTRNYFRNELLPQVQKVYPQAEENISNTIKRLQQTATLYHLLTDDLKKKVCEPRGEEIFIPVLKLMKYKHTSLIFEIIRAYGFGEGTVDEVIKLSTASSGKYIANADYRIIRHRKWFIISPLATPDVSLYTIDKETDEITFKGGNLRFKRTTSQHFKLDTSALIAQVDASAIDYPLVLRRWKTGDYFYPLGLRKKKKLARFFIDQKLSKLEKEKVWVLESHKRIVWIIGYRIDDRFKITDATQKILSITIDG